MIANVIDRRTRPYRWKRVNAVVEPAWHDSPDSDQATPAMGELDYEEKTGVSVKEAIAWAEDLSYSVTLYLSDA
jgi:hypothetical protein